MKQKVPVVLVVLIHFITSRIIQPMPAYYYYAFSEDTLVPDLRTGIIVSIVLIIVDYFAGTFLLKSSFFIGTGDDPCSLFLGFSYNLSFISQSFLTGCT